MHAPSPRCCQRYPNPGRHCPLPRHCPSFREPPCALTANTAIAHAAAAHALAAAAIAHAAAARALATAVRTLTAYAPDNYESTSGSVFCFAGTRG